MASIIKSNTYADFNGREILTANNDGILTTQKINVPAFSASLSAAQTISDSTLTKVQYNTVEFDTNNAYDNSTNYRFTVPANCAGKYMISFSNYMRANNLTAFSFGDCEVRKNGTAIDDSFVDTRSGGNGHQFQIGKTHFLDLSVGDYIEVFARIDISSGTCQVSGTNYNSVFMGMRIGS